ncbi:MAG: branched-chain amino acid aminotransferase [Lentisphaeria bacterium]|nr:branched-chain amino acid aminotransferase [Lentisphaeria bacterium]
MANIDWSSLGFCYMQTKSFIRYTYKDGAWGEGELLQDPYIPIHIAATALHYGQAAFEGLKAFSQPNGDIGVFRLDENAKRLANTASRVMMAEVPEEMFREAVLKVVEDNKEFVPPAETGGSLYIRPLLYGSGPCIGVQPSEEYTFIVLVMPVGDYYKGGLQPVRATIIDGYDRAAPNGVGHVKVAGNYAASLEPSALAKKAGCPINLYLDAKENKYIDEFGTSNFIAITKDGTYVTPKSTSILPSITNKSLMELASFKGITVEQRAIDIAEIKDFTEIAACGTAVVITPVNELLWKGCVKKIGFDGSCGPILQDLYNHVKAIQSGTTEDVFGWNTLVKE